MKSLNGKIFALAVIMALVTSLLLYFYISKLDSGSNDIEYTEIYAAKAEIPARTVIKDDMLVKVQVPKDSEIPMGLPDKSRLVGKMSKERIIKGEIILQDRLFTGEKTEMAFLIPAGKRAVTIGVNEVAEVGGFIIPGDNVDVIATFDEAENYYKFTKVILQNVQVLGIGQSMQVKKEEKQELAVSVTLAVTLEEAEKLILADESGVLRLALKPAADNNSIRTNGVVKDDMVVPKGKIGN